MRYSKIIEKWLTIQKPIVWSVAIFLLFIAAGMAFADDDKEYLNANPEQAKAYIAAHTGVFNEQGQRVGATIAEVQAKAQAEADAQSAVWRQRMDAAASGHPDANFIADNKANFDLWASKHPAEAAVGNVQAASAEVFTPPQGTPTFGTTLNAKPVTLDGTPVGLSGFDEPKPTPTTAMVQANSLGGADAKQSREAVKVEIVKASPPAKALVSYEKHEGADHK